MINTIMDTLRDVTDIEYLALGSDIKFTLYLNEIDGDILNSPFTVLVYTESRDRSVSLESKELNQKKDGGYVVFADSAKTGIGKVKALVCIKVSDPEAPQGVRQLNKVVESNIVVIP